jgi:lipopolysaccharide transport system ATP-binding protein
MHPAIRIDNVTKCFRLGSRVQGGLNLTERFASLFRRARKSATDFWALNGVSFEVNRGEAVGIIGRNGAGKSTLLKVLSRIVEPTGGRVELRGRVGSLLEVGTGFHPELTGRENIFLNGSVLGMTRREIARNFDTIVAFAGVEQFLDTPVKRYSSGMYVRLAFAVAAHLEPEILIVDEVLAVGDASFQKRCIDRMTELTRGGRTILFVSHNMQLIPLLCRSAVQLDQGRVVRSGPAGEVTSAYLQGLISDSRSGDLRDKPRVGDGRARFVRAWIADENGQPLANHLHGDDLRVCMEIESSVAVPDVAAAVVVASQHGTRIVTSWTREVGHRLAIRPGSQVVECRFRNATFRPGHTLLLHLWLSDGEVLDSVENAVVVEVVGGEGHDYLSRNADQGVVVFGYDWREVPPG